MGVCGGRERDSECRKTMTTTTDFGMPIVIGPVPSLVAAEVFVSTGRLMPSPHPIRVIELRPGLQLRRVQSRLLVTQAN